MEEKPLVTVLLTVYNRESVVSTIESVLKQTYENFEFLIVDNASTDNTRDVINSYDDPRINLVVNEENRGQTYSMNRGLKLAKGKYIARIDADDLMAPDRLEKQVEFMEANPDHGLCGSWVQYITDDDTLAMVIKTCTTDESFRFCQLVGCAAYHPSVILRKSVLDEHGLQYDPEIKIAEDYDLWCRMQAVGKCTNLPQVLTYYRRGATSDSRTHADVAHREEYEIRQRLCDGLSGEQKALFQKIINVELKKKKCLITYFTLNSKYKKLEKLFLGSGHPDGEIIKRFIRTRRFAECVVYNKALWAKLALKLYGALRAKEYKKAAKKEGKLQ